MSVERQVGAVTILRAQHHKVLAAPLAWNVVQSCGPKTPFDGTNRRLAEQ